MEVLKRLSSKLANKENLAVLFLPYFFAKLFQATKKVDNLCPVSFSLV